jgi:hypothetical protein
VFCVLIVLSAAEAGTASTENAIASVSTTAISRVHLFFI